MIFKSFYSLGWSNLSVADTNNSADTVELSGISGLENIEFGTTYDLKSWTDYGIISPDPNAPPNGFGFKNSVPASVLVELEIGDTYVPGSHTLSNMGISRG